MTPGLHPAPRHGGAQTILLQSSHSPNACQTTTLRLPPLDRLAVFDAAARQLSFTKAAAERFLTQSAVSRQVAALEEELGVALFRRRHRALELTDDGRLLAEAVGRAMGTVRDALATIRAPGRREVLAVTTTPGLASLWLIPRLADFVARHPGVDVRIDASYQPRPLAAEGFDLAIRYTTLDGATGLPLFGESILPGVRAQAAAQRPGGAAAEGFTNYDPPTWRATRCCRWTACPARARRWNGSRGSAPWVSWNRSRRPRR